MRLYDAFAAGYDQAFDTDPVRRAYEQLTWEMVARLLPPAPAHVIDAGAGTGRGVVRLLALGYTVTALEPSPGMLEVLRDRVGTAATIIEAGFDDAAPPEADAVLATGSVQYAPDPAASIRRMAGWLRPGGLLLVQVDSLLGVALELVRLGRVNEAVRRARDGWGEYTSGGTSARLRLFDRATLADALVAAGLDRVDVRGVLVGAGALGRDGVVERLKDLANERAMADVPALADAGKHLVGWGWR